MRSKAIGLGGTVYVIGGVEDHVHVVASVPPTVALSTFVGQVKGVSSPPRLFGLTLFLAMFLTLNLILSAQPVFAAGETCFATINGTDVYSSTDALALRNAISDASAGATVKVAGICAGVVTENGSDQVAYISQTLTIQGGYTPTNWTTSYPVTQTTILDAQGGGRVIYATADLTMQDLTMQHGSSLQGGGLRTTSDLTLSNVNGYSNTTTSNGTGAGVYADGQVMITGGLFSENIATGDGGEVYTAQTLTVVDTQFISNTGMHGGGNIY